ncbi:MULTISPECIES: 1-deoxy-D-xylulose-5-phosphate reductoisomerase [Oceanimonas]|uniref:1-deoxy-D-xylulose 5-phosphate reductoisomerase n=1 Tax=Oceanimonas doudoroffii TaxID=84158 RepID=A0A233REP1_9GAMM|nr:MULTISPECIES: 1-deoxy-D-xylulose-5-phosphate reductoisomerase [Oceanimonas]NHI01374.1 1-deoxy-D-xylulose 5-phosphate reductoisomerase [Oceanimonas sp. MB9]OXY81861.1 1-deoxy-D-xylulose-5-phosphate reductoisomerase [Oceanimonas doudoroffii]
MQQLTILGASGSIGQSTLGVVRRHPERFGVFALTASRQVERMLADCLEFAPRFAVMAEPAAAAELRRRLNEAGSRTQVLDGAEALCQVAAEPEVDTVMAAIVGAAGLLPTLAAVRAGKRVLLANKEALVMSGELFIDAVHHSGAELLPVDSEHNAIFQCLPPELQRTPGRGDLAGAGIGKILLTGSGGPFRYTPVEQLSEVTPAEAVNHPNWSMGPKISVDSATMMNKGLEYIEARWLFNAAPHQIDVLVHPQSVIHSMVQYSDGSVLAQLGQPDMMTPIAHSLAWPERIESGVAPLDFTRLGELSFMAPDMARYPCLQLAIDACGAGQGATTALNAANEVAVAAFLERRLAFMAIAGINQKVMDSLGASRARSLEDILALDAQARRLAGQLIGKQA